MTKKALADALDLSLPTVTNIAKILLENGYISECGSAESSVGRKPALITINKSSHVSVGIFVSTHSVEIAVVNFSGEILAKESFAIMYAANAAYWTAISDQLEQMIASLELDSTVVLGVCMAVPPALSPESLLTVDEDTAADITSINEIGNYFSRKISIIPAAMAAGTPRLWYGSVSGDAVVVLLSRFIDGCLMQMNAAEHIISYRSIPLGHLGLNPNGKRCFCGKRGCFQTYCSTSLMIDTVNGLDTSMDMVGKAPQKPLITSAEIFASIEAGNEEYAALWDEYLDNLAYALHNVRMLFCGDIILCGETSQYITKYKPVLVEKLKALASFDDDVNSWLHTSNRPEYDVSVGAALYMCDNMLGEF